MMLWRDRASRASWEAGAEPAAAVGPPAARAGVPMLAEPREEPGEQADSSRAMPDIRPAQVSAVVRSGPRNPRARTEVFMPLGRARPGGRFPGPGHVPVTDCPGRQALKG